MSELDTQESEFERQLRAVPFDDALRPEHRETLRNQALAKFDLTQQAGANRPRWKQILNSGRQIMRRPIPRLIAVCSACLAIAVTWMFLPGSQSTAEAFNRYAAAIVAAKTARYQVEVKVEGQPSVKAKAFYFAPGRYRQEIGPMITVGDFKSGKMVMLSPAQKTAIVMVPKGQAEKDQKQHNYFERLRELLSADRKGKEGDYVRIGEKEISGKRATGFQFDSPAATVTLWGDPATGLPLRIETIWSGIPKAEVNMFDFEADVKLDEALFDMTPPADYKVQSFDLDASKPLEADLIAAFKGCSEISGGEFPEAMDTASIQKVIFKYTARPDRKKKTLTDEDTQQLMKHSMTIGRGFQYALELPESADAHYAGKGIQRDTKDRPIFWYKPADAQKYRVIYADLSVREADAAPTIPDTQRIKKAGKGARPTREK